MRNIEVHYGDLQALWGISLDVQEHEVVTVIGPNGAGKSTLLKTISGLLKPTSGSIHFNEVQLNGLPPHRLPDLGICLIPEDKKLFPGMTVIENLELGAYSSRARKDKAGSLDFVYEIFPVLKTKRAQEAGTLSGGEQQMLAIGRGLMSQPKLMLLDEPSLGLAPLLMLSIFDVIGQIKNRGVTVLLVEQNVHMALGIAARAYILETGRIVGHGDSSSLLNDEHVKNAYLGT